MDSTQTVLRSAKSFFAGTALSRVSGFLRDIAVAISFGSSPEIAAFMVAYRLANLFRRLLGEGNLQAGFVPFFAQLQDGGGRFFRDVTYSMAVILIAVIVLLEAFLWAIYGFVPENWQSITELTAWMIPGLFFISLYGLNSSLLQCQKQYFLPAIAPVVFNVVWILAVLIHPNVIFLSIAITIAFAGQWLITAFAGIKLIPLKEWIKPQIFSPNFQKLIQPLLLGIVGIGAEQINSALDAIFARIADLQGPAYLWYAIRLQQLPIGLFGLALSGALLPPLTRAESPEKKQELLQSALKTGITLMLIATFGILSLGGAGINLLYGHGDFTPKDVTETSKCLYAYGLGLVPAFAVLVLATKYFAEKNYKIPTMASLVSVAANIGLNALFVFVFNLGAVSIALATTLSACLNALLLAKGAFTQSLIVHCFKTTLICVLATLLLGESTMLTRDLMEQLSYFIVRTSLFLSMIGAGLFLLDRQFILKLLGRS